MYVVVVKLNMPLNVSPFCGTCWRIRKYQARLQVYK